MLILTNVKSSKNVFYHDYYENKTATPLSLFVYLLQISRLITFFDINFNVSFAAIKSEVDFFCYTG